MIIAIVGGTIAGVLLAFLVTSCIVGAQEDERCGWK